MAITRWPFQGVKSVEDLAIPAVTLLISFLSYSSQYLFYYIDPAPLNRRESIYFNTCVLAIWWCYYKACTVDPGPKGWVGVEEATLVNDDGPVNEKKTGHHEDIRQGKKGMAKRLCKKCNMIKPPRAHHCKKCARCIPKMDHHCPWTSNCVSYTTFPHFIRFIFYAVVSMSILAYHLGTRALLIWDSRNLPAYLGPPIWTLAHLLVLILLNSFTLLILAILLVRVGYGLIMNTTMIESWEMERHEAVIHRAKRNGGWVYANGGAKVAVQKMEFPYDIGFWRNAVQGMGTGNILLWFWPFSGTLDVEDAGSWETNGFEDEGMVWPPLDPEKMYRASRPPIPKMEVKTYGTAEEEKEAFRRRQEDDFARRGISVKDEEVPEDEEDDEDENDSGFEEGTRGDAGWRNSDGERLRDFGVDEETEEIDEDDDDIPLGELLRRRKGRMYDEIDN